MCIFSIAAVKSEIYYITATTDKRKFPIYFASAWRMVILKRKSYDIIPQLFKIKQVCCLCVLSSWPFWNSHVSSESYSLSSLYILQVQFSHLEYFLPLSLFLYTLHLLIWKPQLIIPGLGSLPHCSGKLVPFQSQPSAYRILLQHMSQCASLLWLSLEMSQPHM